MNKLSQNQQGPTTAKERHMILDALRGLVYVELTAIAVFVLQIVVCKWWFRRFRFGPLEWVWRMLTYGRYFQFKVTKEGV